ncbi:MAG: hypothetical protein BMS9Abin11_1710 [Gammaproteobacteria bacterium]|nr:MAG: hypothetical protein BMS9Abin11_1710 [Gammaproteobacteria bacterium]
MAVISGLHPVITIAEIETNNVQYDAPTLLKLGYRDKDKIKTLRVTSKRGYYRSPAEARMHRKWKILPGANIESSRQPRLRIVSLYKGTNRNRVLICKIIVRYFRDPENKTRWVPYFQLNQEHLAIRRNGQWNPVTTIRGVPTLVVITSTTLPNPYGYYSSLEFGLTNQQTKIDSWLVQ